MAKSGDIVIYEDPLTLKRKFGIIIKTAHIVGSINSVHDLMGRIIINTPPPNGDIELANANKIYYGEYNSDISDNKGFYFKDKTYEL